MLPTGAFVKGTWRHQVMAKPGTIVVAKMASHAIFQYNVLAIDDTHNTWTNVLLR